MPFKRFVEFGRVALINYGPLEGKICTIIDVVDQNRALIDGPAEETGVQRQIINFKRLSLTDLVVDGAKRNMKKEKLAKLFKEQNISQRWNATSWGRKLAAKKRRANLTDFERFQAMILNKKRSAITNVTYKALKAGK